MLLYSPSRLLLSLCHLTTINRAATLCLQQLSFSSSSHLLPA